MQWRRWYARVCSCGVVKRPDTGSGALYSNTTGWYNTASGSGALSFSTGSNNIAVGFNAGDNITIGSTAFNVPGTLKRERLTGVQFLPVPKIQTPSGVKALRKQ